MSKGAFGGIEDKAVYIDSLVGYVAPEYFFDQPGGTNHVKPGRKSKTRSEGHGKKDNGMIVKEKSGEKEDRESLEDSSDQSNVIKQTTKIQLNKFRFDDGLKTSLRVESKKRKDSLGNALEKAKKSKEKMKELESSTETLPIVQDELWKAAEKKASGVRIKDDVQRIKKSIKKRDSIKKKSRKEWQERLDGVKTAQAAKAKRRAQNIKDRKQSIKKKRSKH